MRKVLWILAALAAAGTNTPAIAAEVIWFDSDHTAYNGDYSAGTSLLFSGGGVNVRVSGWSIYNGVISKAQLGVWPDGLGVKNGSGDNSHTIDNSGYLDFILLQFDQTVELEKVRFWTGWHGMNDTDATLGYTDSSLPFGTPPSLHGVSQAQLADLNLYGSGGWGNSGDSFREINLTGNVGNLWLVGASFNNPEGSRKLDGFKMDKLTFSFAPTSAVPEPSTWAMMLLGFLGLGAAMRAPKRKQDLPASYA